MPPPNLTQPQIDQLNIELARQQNLVTTFNGQIPAQTTRIGELTLVDSAYKAIYDYYSVDIIGNYDQELAALNGTEIISPIVEADIVNVANLTGRLLPTPPNTDVIRVSEFDGGGTQINPDNETQHLTLTEQTSNILQNGYGSGTATSATSTTPLLPTSTTLSATNIGAETISTGDFYILDDGFEIAVIEVTSTTDGGGADPPFLTDLGINVIVPPTVQVNSGATFLVFTGFSDGERTSKIASNPNLQPLMDSLIQDLEDDLNARILTINTQDVSIGANQDDDGTAEFSAQLILNNTAILFIQNYLIGTDISDVGLLSLSTEKTSRDGEVSSRIVQILANYTGQPSGNYYDLRYDLANERGNIVRGSLRLQVAGQDVLNVSTQYAATAQSSVDSITNILP